MQLRADAVHAFNTFSHYTEITQMAVVLAVVVVVTGVLHMFKQPTIIGYLVAGILLGPVAFNVVAGPQLGGDMSFVQLFSSLGIALLLFMVGLDLNLTTIKEYGKVALIVAGTQVVLTGLFGYILASFLGFDMIEAIYIAAALAFSSTIIIIKLLTDKREIETLYGKITSGVLIVQDLIVMICLMVMSITGTSSIGGTSFMVVDALILLVVFVIIAVRILPKVMNRFAKSQEYLLLIGMCRCLLVGAMFLRVGFSFEIGCLLAGISLSVSPYRKEMAHRLRSLKDFFLVLFFINIGLQLSFDNIGPYVWSIVILALFVVLVKPLLVYGVLRMLEYTHKTSIKTSFSLGQISEFSFLMVAMGVSLGHLQNPVLLSVVMCVGLISFVLSGYSISYNEGLFRLAKRIFGMRDRMTKKEEKGMESDSFDALLFGYGRMGARVSKVLDQQGMKHIIVDHSPTVYGELLKAGKPHVYADATNEEVYREYIECGIRMIVSTITDFEDTLEILKDAKTMNPHVAVVVVATDAKKALSLYEAGADYVIVPSHVSAQHMGMMIQEMQTNFDAFLIHKEEHRRSIEG